MVSGKAVVTMRQAPIHELLNRIRWDAEFARGKFELGYFDRVEKRTVVVPFAEVSFPGMTRRCSGLRMGRGGFVECLFTVFGKCIKTASVFGIGQRGRAEWPFPHVLSIDGGLK